MDLLEKHRPFDTDAERDAAKEIVRRLGGFALAIELVAAYLAVHKGAGYQSILDTSLDTLAEAEQRTMEFAAFLPPDNVALPWLKALVVPTAVPPITDPWTEIVSRLTGLALLTRPDEAEPRIARIHRMVQQVVKSRMSPPTPKRVRRKPARIYRC
jgi:hypothetical protein